MPPPNHSGHRSSFLLYATLLPSCTRRMKPTAIYTNKITRTLLDGLRTPRKLVSDLKRTTAPKLPTIEENITMAPQKPSGSNANKHTLETKSKGENPRNPGDAAINHHKRTPPPMVCTPRAMYPQANRVLYRPPAPRGRKPTRAYSRRVASSGIVYPLANCASFPSSPWPHTTAGLQQTRHIERTKPPENRSVFCTRLAVRGQYRQHTHTTFR